MSGITMIVIFSFLLQIILQMQMGASTNTATTPIPQKAQWWMSRHEAFNERDKLAVQAQLSMGPEENRVDLLYIGDSIVHRFETVGRAVWNHYYASRHGFNLGINGDRTQHVLWRLNNGNIAGLSPKLAIVMIGQNNGDSNTAMEIYEGVSAIVNMLLAKLPRTKILLLGIFQRRQYPTPERKILAECNELLAKQFRNNEMVTFMDIDNIFLQQDGSILASDMPDFEHPSPMGYVKWAEAIEDTVSKLFSDTRKEKLVISSVTDMTHLKVERAVSDVNDPRVASAYGNGLKSPPGTIDNTPRDSIHMHSRFHHWGIVIIFCIVSVVFYFGVYMILADSNVESKRILTNHLISKAGSASPRSPRSDISNFDNSEGGSIPLTTTIRAPDNRNKG